MNISSKNKANETSACCCVDVGSIIDNDSCLTEIDQFYTSRAEAEARLARLIQRAKQAESDPCQISHRIEDLGEGVRLVARFEFCCGVENLIFQLHSR